MTTPANNPARAATAPELVKFRANGASTRLNLAIQHPATVYAARVNGTPASLDGLAEIIYDGGSGTLANVLPEMTLLVGSAAGLRDKGFCRIRKAPTATVFYISPSSDMQVADNDYLTVIDAMPLAQRDITATGGTVRVDYDIEYGINSGSGIIPRIGGLASVIKSSGGSATFTPVNPSLSAGYDGRAITAYLFDAPGASTTLNMDSPTAASWTYPAGAAEYRWSCAITDNNGRVTTAYRRVFVDPPQVEFNLDSCSGDIDGGDWTFAVTCYSGVTLADVFDRALVALYREDIYNGVAGEVGKVAGYENIEAVGWIDGESIVYDVEAGTVSFSVHGAAHWMGKLRAFPFEMTDTSSAPANWKQIQEMTVDKALAHLLYLTSNAPLIMDCFFTGDTTRVKVLTQPAGSLWSQVQAISQNTIFAKPAVNNYGQLFVEVNSQIADSATRATFPAVMDITKEDFIGGLDLARITSSRAAMVELGGATAYDGTTATPVYSRAPGNTPRMFGDMRSVNNVIVADQSEANRIAGALLAEENVEYEPLDVEFASNVPLFDIAPRMYATLSLSSGDTLRGVTLTAQKLIPRKINRVWDADNCVMGTRITFEFATSGGVNGVTYIPPKIMQDNLPDVALDDFGIKNVDFPSAELGSWFPTSLPTTPPAGACVDTVPNVYTAAWDDDEIRGDDATLTSRLYYPCKVRAATATHKTKLQFPTIPSPDNNDAAAHITLYAIKDGNRVLTASIVDDYFVFSPTVATDVDGFEVELDAGLGASPLYTPLDVIVSGSKNSKDTSRTSISIPANTLLSVEGIGSWRWVAGGVTAYGIDLWNINSFVGPSEGTPINRTAPYSLYVEALPSLNTRYYFNSLAITTAWVMHDDGYYPDNATTNDGSIGYAVRNVRVDGRRILLGEQVVENVCAVG